MLSDECRVPEKSNERIPSGSRHSPLATSKRVLERDRTVTFGFTGRHAGTTTPRTPCIPRPGIEPGPQKTQHGPLGPGRDFRFTIRERKERELNPQGTVHARSASNRFPSPFGWPFRCLFDASTRTRTQNIPLEAGHDFHFTIEAAVGRSSSSGRQGIRTLTTNWPHGLANRPGKPYPATFRKSARGGSTTPISGPTGSRTPCISFPKDRPACRAGVVPLDHDPVSLSVDRRGVEPRSSGCKPDVVPLDQQPRFQKVRPGIEPELRPYQGRVQPQHLQTVLVD